MYVYLNGREVGYSEDSKTSAEFAVSDYLVPGENTLVLKIYRWSTGSYLECQDFGLLADERYREGCVPVVPVP